MNIRDYWGKNTSGNTNKLKRVVFRSGFFVLIFLRKIYDVRIFVGYKIRLEYEAMNKVCTMYGSKYEPSYKGN